MINSFKKKISKKWVAITTLILGLFWKVSTAKAVAPLAVAGGFVLVETVMKLLFGTTITGMTLQAIIGGIIALLIYTVGGILTVLIWILFQAAKYSDFINAPVVTGGWVVIRDISNMFFILILLIIAFATILRLESYSWKKNLPKLLIMAVLINFSKTICGLVIDFGQVIMLTFINAFGDAGPGNLITTFGVEKLYSMSLIADKDVSALNNLGAMLLGLIMLIITCIVVGVFAIILVYRIVILWILIILSPLAFLAMAIPAGAKYAQQWTGELAKNIIVGPILAFFLWLALLYGSSSTVGVDLSKTNDTNVPTATISQMGYGNNMQKFIVAVALLIGGLMMAQQMGGAIGGIAGKGMAWAKKAPMLMGKGALGLSSWGARKLKLATGYEIRPTKIIAGFREALADKKRREEITAESKSATALRKGGVTGLIKGLGASRDLTEAGAKGFLWHRAWFGKQSMIAQTIKAGGLRKDIAKMEKDLAKATEEKAEDQVADLTKQIAGKTKELEITTTPYTYFADQKRNAAIREQVSKIGDNDNEEDLIAMFNAAVARGDKETASAVYITASKVGHANEIIQSQKADEDVKDDFGNVVIKKDGYLDESVYGMHALTSQILMKKLGMSEQEAFNVQSQASTNAKSVGHFNLAESIGVKNGMLYQRTGEYQQQRARGELRKVDPEKFVRNFNRLAYGDEEQHYDETQGKIVRNFKINKLGMSNILENAAEISKEIGNRRFNHNAAMNMATDIEGIKKYYEALKPEERTFYDPNKDNGKDEEKGGHRDYMEVINEIEKFGKSIAEGEDRAKAVQERIKTIKTPPPQQTPPPQTP